jgi:peptidoglycan glycosyltransferase
VREILARERDVHLTIDIRLQREAAHILEQHIHAAGKERGAAVVIEASTGELLASVSYPSPAAGNPERYFPERDEGYEGPDAGSLLDRPRFGLYPPGSAFKLITACAALETRPGAESEIFECKNLPDGRVGNVVRGWRRPVRDDVLDTSPHGNVAMASGLIHSCNAYFAQLGTYVVGAQRLLRTAEHFGIAVASPNTAAILQDALPQASYGQGQVVATPLQMARVAAAIGNGGKFYPTWWDAAQGTPVGKQVLAADEAELLSGYMRRVVTEGTGQVLKNLGIPIAGKTGTAELKDQPSHAWFVGFAPYSGQNRRRISFAVIVENGRYGGRVAAPLAGEIIAAASRLGIID